MARRTPLPLAALLLAVVPPLAAARWPVQTFDVSRGLAGDRVWDLELDGAGALWIATATGVSRFDGVRFRNFDVRHGLPNPNVVRLALLPDGRLAAGTGAGVAIVDPIEGTGERPWRALPCEEERGGGLLLALAVDGDGRLWAGGALGLFLVEGAKNEERLSRRPLPAGETSVRLLADDREGGLWADLDSGLYRRSRAGEWSGPWGLPAPLADLAGPTDLRVDASGALWIASRRAICSIAPNGGWGGARGPLAAAVPTVALAAASAARAGGESFCLGVDGGLPPTRSSRLFEPAGDGRLFVTGSEGVLEVGAASVALRLSNGEVGDATLQSALEGPGRGLWIATADRGLLRQIASGVEIAGGGEALPGTASTLLVRESELAVAVDLFDPRRKLMRLEGERFVDRTPGGASELEVSWGWGPIATFGPEGDWWVGRQGGVARFPRRPDGSFGAAVAPPESLARALAGEEPIRLFFARDGALWVASFQPPALHRMESGGTGVVAFPEIATFPLGPPTALAEGATGTIWTGFYRGGLARRRGEGAFEWIASEPEVVRGFVYSLAFDRGGRLWVAAGGGLVLCVAPEADDPGCGRAFPGTELDHLQTFGVVEDAAGRVVVGSSKGLFVVEPRSGRVDLLTTADGIPANTVAALAPAADGGVWAAAERGIVHLEPTLPAGEPAPVRIVSLTVAGRRYPVPLAGVARIDRLEISPAERIVEIEVASVHLGAGPPPAYQWRVGDGAWSQPASDRMLRLAGLAAGDLAIEARAVSHAGHVGREVASLGLRVLPPLWRRSWFLVATGAIVAALLALALRARVRRMLELERVRTRIAADLHDDLGASLARISILAEVARRQEPGVGDRDGTLETIGASARQLAEMASDIVWAIDPQRDDLASWVARLRRFGEDLFAPLGVRFEVAAPPDAARVRLAAAVRRDLFLLAKEALANAAKYAQAKRVTVTVRSAGGRLEVAIEDDGCGLPADATAAAEARGGGRGLRTMRERAERLGGRLELARRPGGGTRVALAFPL